MVNIKDCGKLGDPDSKMLLLSEHAKYYRSQLEKMNSEDNGNIVTIKDEKIKIERI